MKMMDLSAEERPREKMRQKGAKALSNAEVLRRALSAIGLGLMDHVVVAEGSFYSFSEERVGKG